MTRFAPPLPPAPAPLGSSRLPLGLRAPAGARRGLPSGPSRRPPIAWALAHIIIPARERSRSPAWHRRERRRRREAWLLLRLDAARRLLQGHHGESALQGSMAPKPRRAELAKKWTCRFCKHPRTGEEWWNRSDAASCGQCGRSKGVCYKADLQPKGACPSKSAKVAAAGGAAQHRPGSPPSWKSCRLSPTSLARSKLNSGPPS